MLLTVYYVKRQNTDRYKKACGREGLWSKPAICNKHSLPRIHSVPRSDARKASGLSPCCSCRTHTPANQLNNPCNISSRGTPRWQRLLQLTQKDINRLCQVGIQIACSSWSTSRCASKGQGCAKEGPVDVLEDKAAGQSELSRTADAAPDVNAAEWDRLQGQDLFRKFSSLLAERYPV